MKHILKAFTLLFFAALTFIGCDIIDDPLKPGGVISQPDTTVVLRKIVVEDFTGHRCKNCPDAAKMIKTLEGIYGEQIVGLAIHAGPGIFTAPTPDYPPDYRTPEGNQTYSFFGIPGLPYGMVSRADWSTSGSNHLKSYQNWPTAVANIADDPAQFSIAQTVTYTDADSTVTVKVTVTALAEMLDDLMISIILTENGIVSPQLMPDDTRNVNYVHNHLLRTMYTPALGELLQPSPIQEGQVFTKTFSGKIRKTAWVAGNCDILTYVYNATNYEILQAEVTPVVP
jgi:hypothetical protein